MKKILAKTLIITMIISIIIYFIYILYDYSSSYLDILFIVSVFIIVVYAAILIDRLINYAFFDNKNTERHESEIKSNLSDSIPTTFLTDKEIVDKIIDDIIINLDKAGYKITKK